METLTLCHVSGCFPAALPHSTDEVPAAECTPSDSPLRPTCVAGNGEIRVRVVLKLRVTMRKAVLAV